SRKTLLEVQSLKGPAHVSTSLYYELGLVERALDKLPEARAKFQRAIQIFDDEPGLPRRDLSLFLLPVAEISYELGDFDGAARTYQRLVSLFPVEDVLHWNYLRWLGRCQWDMGLLDAS